MQDTTRNNHFRESREGRRMYPVWDDGIHNHLMSRTVWGQKHHAESESWYRIPGVKNWLYPWRICQDDRNSMLKWDRGFSFAGGGETSQRHDCDSWVAMQQGMSTRINSTSSEAFLLCETRCIAVHVVFRFADISRNLKLICHLVGDQMLLEVSWNMLQYSGSSALDSSEFISRRVSKGYFGTWRKGRSSRLSSTLIVRALYTLSFYSVSLATMSLSVKSQGISQ